MSWLRSEAAFLSAWAYEKHRNGGMGGRFGRAWACTASELGSTLDEGWTEEGGVSALFFFCSFLLIAAAGFAGILPVC